MCLLIVKDCQSQSSRIVCVKGKNSAFEILCDRTLVTGVVITSLPSLFLAETIKRTIV